MPQFERAFSPISATLQGLIVSCILITAALSSVAAGPLSDRISRTRSFTLGSAIFALGSVLCASASALERKRGLAQLLAGRLLAGAGEGLFLGVIIVYTCEIAPKESRGRLACTLQLFITIGIALGSYSHYLHISRRAYTHYFRLFFLLRLHPPSELTRLARTIHSPSVRCCSICRGFPVSRALTALAAACRTAWRCSECVGASRPERGGGREGE